MNCPYPARLCTECGKLLIVCPNNFAKKKGGKYGFASKCKKCRSEYHQKYKEHDNSRNAKYYKKNKEKILKRQQEYKNNNLEKVKEQNRQKNKRYRERHPETSVNVAAKRRFKEETQGSGLTTEQFLDMMNFFEWKCAYSGTKFSSHNEKKDRTIDHIIPLNKNGEHEVWNMIPMYSSYNYSKRDCDFLEWYKSQDFFDEKRLNKIYEWQKYAKNKYKNNKRE